MLRGWHDCKNSIWGDWILYELGTEPRELHLYTIEHLLTKDRLQSLKHEDISWKGKNLPSNMVGTRCGCCAGARYASCDTSIPCIVLDKVSNPDNLRYRMIDGKHRMMKMRLHGQLDSIFYVLSLDEVLPYIKIA